MIYDNVASPYVVQRAPKGESNAQRNRPPHPGGARLIRAVHSQILGINWGTVEN